MKKFWPHRSESKGFTVKNFVRNCRLNISNLPNNEITEKSLKDSNKVSVDVEVGNFSVSKLSIRKIHWANRDFSEYKNAA